jgi:hypothetical protein
MPGLGGSNGDVLTYNNGYIEFTSSSTKRYLYTLVPNTTNASTITSLIANDFTISNTWWYEYQTNTYSNGPAHGRGDYAFLGGVLAPNGNIILVPLNSSVIGIYDPITNTYSNGPAHGRGLYAFIGGVLAPNGNVILAPYKSPVIGIYGTDVKPLLNDTFERNILLPYFNKF